MAFDVVVKVVFRLSPRLVMAVIAATAIKAAIKPYSIAVAPFSFFNILRMNCILNLLIGNDV